MKVCCQTRYRTQDPWLMSQVPYRLRYAARPLTFVRYRGCWPRFSAAFTPHLTPSPHTPRGTWQMFMQWKTMFMPLLHKSNRQLFGYFFSYSWARPRRAVGIAFDSRARNPGSVPGPATINHCVKFAVQQYGSATVWQYSSVAIQQDRVRQYGSLIVWQYSSMAVQQRGSTAVWQCSQQYGSAEVHKKMKYFRIRTLKTFVLSVSKYKCVD